MAEKQIDFEAQIVLAHSALDLAIKRTDYTIFGTPTSDKRNLLTEANILMLQAKGKLEAARIEEN